MFFSITIVQANLRRDTSSMSDMDPYVKLQLVSNSKVSRKTKTIKQGGKRPKWNQKLQMPFNKQNSLMKLTVFDAGVVKDTQVASIQIQLKDYINIPVEKEELLDLSYQNKVCGKIKCIIRSPNASDQPVLTSSGIHSTSNTQQIGKSSLINSGISKKQASPSYLNSQKETLFAPQEDSLDQQVRSFKSQSIVNDPEKYQGNTESAQTPQKKVLQNQLLGVSPSSNSAPTGYNPPPMPSYGYGQPNPQVNYGNFQQPMYSQQVPMYSQPVPQYGGFQQQVIPQMVPNYGYQLTHQVMQQPSYGYVQQAPQVINLSNYQTTGNSPNKSQAKKKVQKGFSLSDVFKK